jgi:hypothetical protein
MNGKDMKKIALRYMEGYKKVQILRQIQLK